MIPKHGSRRLEDSIASVGSVTVKQDYLLCAARYIGERAAFAVRELSGELLRFIRWVPIILLNQATTLHACFKFYV